MPKILLVEDDLVLGKMICQWLERDGHSVEHATSGATGRELMLSNGFELAVLDWEMPEWTGVDICAQARAQGIAIPVLMLTARGGIDSIEHGLLSGADDYLVKPFALKELSARIRALLRRNRQFLGQLKAGDVTLVPERQSVMRADNEIDLTNTEYMLLEFLMRNPNKVFSVEELLNHVWPSSSDATYSAVTSCIKRLRQKLDSQDSPTLIKSVYGGGYRLEP